MNVILVQLAQLVAKAVEDEPGAFNTPSHAGAHGCSGPILAFVVGQKYSGQFGEACPEQQG